MAEKPGDGCHPRQVQDTYPYGNSAVPGSSFR